ncbi:hypothetical protein F0L68_17760 [Solihabitans fulvus]|uniref:phospholipase D n=1 Tax=Solihabitans fulvus TaxID=1892852 RepID=A0A5B2XC59_9PSEU|nr:phospholipase D-like domain-containing protein [Solihabitans fulvus]KAA2261298.1 hypothetical protein F0L68_17760 [Solihabitans fulvus]
MTDPVSVTFLRDVQHGGAPDQPAQVAAALAAFVTAATTSVDVAIYDFRLTAALAGPVVAALTAAADRGLVVRVAYDAGKPVDGTVSTFAEVGADPAPAGTADWLWQAFGNTGVELQAVVAPSGKLMHDKYVIRDRTAVWTGSTNFTDDAWSRQENNIVQLADPALGEAYGVDFDELWETGGTSGTGRGDLGDTVVGDATVAWSFSPGEGKQIDADLAALADAATERLVIGSMVLTSHSVLAALADAVDRGVAVSGIFDGGQMGPIANRWTDPTVLANWATVSDQLVSKPSTPYTPTGPHDFMHLKVLVSDNTVATGSFNFSANATGNAENQLRITSAAIADAYAAYIGLIVETYGP